MVVPTYLVGIQIDLAIAKNNEEPKKKKVLHGAWTSSFKQNLKS